MVHVWNVHIKSMWIHSASPPHSPGMNGLIMNCRKKICKNPFSDSLLGTPTSDYVIDVWYLREAARPWPRPSQPLKAKRLKTLASCCWIFSLCDDNKSLSLYRFCTLLWHTKIIQFDWQADPNWIYIFFQSQCILNRLGERWMHSMSFFLSSKTLPYIY